MCVCVCVKCGCTDTLDELVGSLTKLTIYPALAIWLPKCCELWFAQYQVQGDRGSDLPG